MKLQHKLLISYLAVGLTPLLVIGLYARTYAKQEKFRSISDSFIAQLNQIDVTLSGFLQEVEYDVEGLANNPTVRTHDDEHFTNFLDADEQTFVYVIGAVEQQIIDIFANYKAHHYYVNSVYMGRDNGAFVRSHPRARPTQYDPRERPWYQLALSDPHQVKRTAPYASVTTDDINIGIVKALVDDDERVFGVVGADITLRNLTDVVAHIHIGQEGYLMLLDDQGLVLSHPDRTKRFHPYIEAGFDGFHDVMEDEQGYSAIHNNGYGQYAFFYTSPLLGWKICAVVPRPEITREINRLTNTIMFILCLTLLAGGLQAYYMSRRITVPVDELLRSITKLVMQLRTHQTFEAIPVTTTDEIARLAQAFNIMGAQLFAAHQELSDYSENLEQMVAQRTQELSESNVHLLQEIAERMRAEEALTQEHNLLRTLIDNLPDFIYIKDTQSRYLLLNRTSVQGMHAEKLEDVLGKSDFDFWPKEQAEHFYAVEQQVIRSGQPFVNQEEMCLNLVTGEMMWLLTTKAPFRDPQGHIIGIVGMSRDITERKRMADELRQANEAALQAQQRAEDANQAKSQFLANMSHELRTPLNGILGYAQILKQEDALTESQQKGVEIIERSGKHLLNLINDILDLSKIEAHKIELQQTPVLLAPFLDDLVSLVRLQAEQKGIVFQLETAPELPAAIQADERRLRQILLNLLSNAVKFTEQGSVTLRVGSRQYAVGSTQSAVRREDCQLPTANCLLPTAYLSFEVSDTGIGIPEDELESIFSAFQQVGKHSRPVEGTGLGLAISRQLVRLMGGELRVRSTVGEGSLFWFELAFPEIAAELAVSPTTEEKRAIGFRMASGPDAGQVPKILVVDDKLENRALLVSLLLALGFVVEEATDGRDSIRKANTFHPDLIFMDLIMPVMDGFEAIRHIRKSPTLSQTRIIAVSASTLVLPDQIRTEFGCNDYLPKPLEIQDVLKTLALHLGVEWIYEEHTAIVGDDRSGEQDEPRHTQEAGNLPPLSDLHTLYNLAIDGNFNMLRNHLSRIEQMDTCYHPFAERIRAFAKTLDEEAICDMLKHCIGEASR